MKLSIISREEVSSDSLMNIKGGAENNLTRDARCTCDCWISNKNEEKADKEESKQTENKTSIL